MKLKWVVEFSVDSVWVSDGFNLNKKIATDMITSYLSQAYTDEIQAKIIKKPSQKLINFLQGH